MNTKTGFFAKKEVVEVRRSDFEFYYSTGEASGEYMRGRVLQNYHNGNILIQSLSDGRPYRVPHSCCRKIK